MVTAPDDRTLIFRTDQAYAPTFLLYCLTAGVGAVVDSKLLQEHEADGDMGHAWLKSNRSEEHTSELQSLMRISYAVFCLKKKKKNKNSTQQYTQMNTDK